MIPLIFALLFAVIEYAYYLGALNYVSYATFAGARAVQANDDPREAMGMLLTGNMVEFTNGVGGDVRLQLDNATGAVQSTLLWEAQTPGFNQVMGVMDAQMTVTLGPPECEYESQAATVRSGVTVNAFRYADNKLVCN